MQRLPFVLTVFVMLLGPIRLIPAFAGLTKGAEAGFKRGLALRGAAIGAAIAFIAALAGRHFVDKYELSLESVALCAGLLLLISALQAIFVRQPPAPPHEGPWSMGMALSPLATPTIVPPVGVAAIIVFTLLEKSYPGIGQAVLIALLIVMTLNLLAMYFNALLLKIPGLLALLQLLGAVLIVIQVALSIEILITAIRLLGLVRG